MADLSSILALGDDHRNKPKAEMAYDYLRSAIITMKMAPGSTLNEKSLCADLGISRTPLREAVLRLSHEGLLTIVPGGGTFVSKISVRGVLQGYLVRSSIECRLITLAARIYKPEFDSDFELLLYLQQDANKRGDFDRALLVDSDFHRRLCRVAGFPDVWKTIRDATGQLDRVNHRAFRRHGQSQEIESEHRAIYDAIRDHDSQQAQALMKRHLGDIQTLIDFVKASTPDILSEDEPLDITTILSSSR